MQATRQIGTVDWSNEELRAAIPEFLALYEQRPIKDNQGGMRSPHLFATWFMLKKIQPTYVVESGIWKGQSTWLIEQTLPNAKVFSIDLNLPVREYISDKVQYFNKDFSAIDWSIIPDKSEALLFFDDHQNAFERIKKGEILGFRKYIFEDNYPSKYGDCYSLKKAFQHAGFTPSSPKKSTKQLIKSLIKPTSNQPKIIPPNTADSDYLERVLKVYYEFPPVFKTAETRWQDDWNDMDYPTVEPLYQEMESPYLNIFEEEAKSYNWICYAEVKEGIK